MPAYAMVQMVDLGRAAVGTLTQARGSPRDQRAKSSRR
jgi:hypothetical protein